MSNEPLNQKDIEAIRARYEQTTPGPWRSFVEGRDHWSGDHFIQTGGEDVYLIGATLADQDFIAHARQDIPRLVAEVERLRAASHAVVDASSRDDAGTLLTILAQINADVSEVGRVLKANDNVAKVTSGRDVRRYGPSQWHDGNVQYVFEGYVEAELKNGQLFAWLIDVGYTAKIWTLSCDIAKWRDDEMNENDGMYSVIDIPDFTASTFREFADEVLSRSRDFVKTALTFEFQ